MFDPDFKTEGAYSPDQLIAGDHPLRFKGISVAAGQGTLVRGTVMVRVGASADYTAYAGTAPDAGTPVTILVNDVDTTGGVSVNEAYLAGDFNTNALTVASGSIDDLRNTMAAQSIYLHDAVKA